MTINATSGTIAVDKPVTTTPGTGGDMVLIGSVVVNDLLGTGHAESGLMSPALSAGTRLLRPADAHDRRVLGGDLLTSLGRAGTWASSDAWVSPWLASPLAKSPLDYRQTSEGVFADLGRDGLIAQDGSKDGTSQLLESKDDEVLAAATVRSGEEATPARVPRRSRMQRYERELDAWFAELATPSDVPFRRVVD